MWWFVRRAVSYLSCEFVRRFHKLAETVAASVAPKTTSTTTETIANRSPVSDNSPDRAIGRPDGRSLDAVVFFFSSFCMCLLSLLLERKGQIKMAASNLSQVTLAVNSQIKASAGDVLSRKSLHRTPSSVTAPTSSCLQPADRAILTQSSLMLSNHRRMTG